MSKKDFELIAQEIMQIADPVAREMAAKAVAAACAQLNARFDSQRFLQACGVSAH